jgi:hypothetical protein
MNHKWLVACVLMVSTWACAQTPWPAGQAENYPMVREMQLVRHDQSVLLGELDMQTGLFYSFLGATSVEKTQNLLIADAQRKGWTLQSAMRFGAHSMLAFAKGARMLDIRLSLQAEGVDAMYSVALHLPSPSAVQLPQPAVYGRHVNEEPIPVRPVPRSRLSASEFKVPAGNPGAR